MATRAITYIATVKDRASKKFDKIGDSSGKASKKMAGIGAAAKAGAAGVAIFAAAAAASVVGLAKFAQHVADIKNDIVDMGARTGLAAETVAGLKLAFEGSGQALGDLDSTLGPFVRKIAKAGDQSKSMDQHLRDALSTIQGLESPTAKATKAVEIFGRSGGRMIQALGSTDLQQFVDMAEHYGVKVGPEAAAAAAQWQREAALLSTAFDGFKASFFEAVGPDGVKAMRFFTDTVHLAAQAIAGTLGALANHVGAVLANISTTIGAVGKAIELAQDGHLAAASGVTLAALDSALGRHVRASQRFGQEISANLGEAWENSFKEFDDVSSDAAGKFTGLVGKGLKKALGPLDRFIDDFIQFKATGQGVPDAVIEHVVNFAEVNAKTGKAKDLDAPRSSSGGFSSVGSVADIANSSSVPELLGKIPGPVGVVGQILAAIENLDQSVLGMVQSSEKIHQNIVDAPDLLWKLAENSERMIDEFPERMGQLTENVIRMLPKFLEHFLFRLPVLLAEAIVFSIGEIVKSLNPFAKSRKKAKLNPNRTGLRAATAPATHAFALGGVVTRPTNALIGEAGPEAVVPLEKMGMMGSVTVNVGTLVADDDGIDELIRRIRIAINQRAVPGFG